MRDTSVLAILLFGFSFVFFLTDGDWNELLVRLTFGAFIVAIVYAMEKTLDVRQRIDPPSS